MTEFTSLPDPVPARKSGPSGQAQAGQVSHDTSSQATEVGLNVELVAVIVAVTQGMPRVLVRDADHALPAGAFEFSHRSLQAALRAWVERQTHHPLGYVEQLYTFADRDRANAAGQRIVSVSYLGLTREKTPAAGETANWQDWYRYFPWEDWREGPPAIVESEILPRLNEWVADAPDSATGERRRRRVALTFSPDPDSWNEELVLQRYELLYEAGCVPEALRRLGGLSDSVVPGTAMPHDHRRILATAMARLRAKIRYHPVVFELMSERFTLLQLQQAFEAVAGRLLHKQNFRRFIEQQALVEETGAMERGVAGRPAKLFQFRRDVMADRAIAGSKLPLAR